MCIDSILEFFFCLFVSRMFACWFLCCSFFPNSKVFVCTWNLVTQCLFAIFTSSFTITIIRSRTNTYTQNIPQKVKKQPDNQIHSSIEWMNWWAKETLVKIERENNFFNLEKKTNKYLYLVFVVVVARHVLIYREQLIVMVFGRVQNVFFYLVFRCKLLSFVLFFLAIWLRVFDNCVPWAKRVFNKSLILC